MPANGAPLSVLIRAGTVLPHGRFADRSDLAEVHTQDDLAADQRLGMQGYLPFDASRVWNFASYSLPLDQSL
jgi:hypothetical protein